jgi:hypothetical protein
VTLLIENYLIGDFHASPVDVLCNFQVLGIGEKGGMQDCQRQCGTIERQLRTEGTNVPGGFVGFYRLLHHREVLFAPAQVRAGWRRRLVSHLATSRHGMWPSTTA